MLKNLAVASSLLTCGCVHVEHIPIDSGFAERVQGRALARSTREQPDFGAMTPGAPVFGLLGGLAAIAAGNDIVRKNAIEDPAGRIAQTLSGDLGTQYGVQVSSGLIPLNSDDVAQLPKDPAAADLLLDVRTLGWGFIYMATKWNRYRVTYRARVRLVDVRNGRVRGAAGKGCRATQEGTEDRRRLLYRRVQVENFLGSAPAGSGRRRSAAGCVGRSAAASGSLQRRARPGAKEAAPTRAQLVLRR